MPPNAEVQAGAKALLELVRQYGYGGYVTIEIARSAAIEVIKAVDRVRIDTANQLELTFGEK